MSKDKLQLLSPLFLKYQTDFEKNPRSRVFAPLAEAYRKLGMTDKAMEILSQGIRFHPSYVMGYLGLAFCYFDLKQFNLAYSTLRPLIETNRDNIRMQKLFSNICLELGKQEEALETLKYLLFINPRDKEVGELVTKLESEIEERFRPGHKPIVIPEKEFSTGTEELKEASLFDLQKLEEKKETSTNDFDDWMTLDLSQESKTETSLSQTTASAAADYDQWSMKKGSEIHPSPKDEAAADDRTYKVHLDLDKEKQQEDLSLKEESTPLVTHTLVDLYCGQGHIEKALEVLEKILLLNPKDQKTINKIKEIQALSQPLGRITDNEVAESRHRPIEPQSPKRVIALADFTKGKNEETSEEDGRRHLMSLIDEKLGPIEIEENHSQVEVTRTIEEKLTLFLKKIQKRALDYQSSV